MITISKGNRLVTLINVFTVEAANQQQLLDLLASATETSVRHVPGFISASLHRSLDGSKVAMYAQWRSIEDYRAMRENPAPLPYLQATSLAKFEPGIYEVVETFSTAVGDA
jgi:quinol monooxygenase YgiN